MAECAVLTLRWWCPGVSALYVRSPLCMTLLWVETPRVGITLPVRSVPVSANSLVAKSCLAVLWCHGTVACQAPLSMGFSRQEYWSRLPFLSLGDIFNPGIEPMSPALAGRFFTTEPPGKPSSAN